MERDDWIGSSLKAALDLASREVDDAPGWLKSIYAQNDAHGSRRAEQLAGTRESSYRHAGP